MAILFHFNQTIEHGHWGSLCTFANYNLNFECWHSHLSGCKFIIASFF